MDEGELFFHRVVRRAKQAAQARFHEAADTEHLLLGLTLACGDETRAALGRVGLGADAVRAAVERLAPPEEEWFAMCVPLSRPAAAVVRRAWKWFSAERRPGGPAAERLLAAELVGQLLAEGGGQAGAVLRHLGVGPEGVAELRQAGAVRFSFSVLPHLAAEGAVAGG